MHGQWTLKSHNEFNFLDKIFLTITFPNSKKKQQQPSQYQWLSDQTSLKRASIKAQQIQITQYTCKKNPSTPYMDFKIIKKDLKSLIKHISNIYDCILSTPFSPLVFSIPIDHSKTSIIRYG